MYQRLQPGHKQHDVSDVLHASEAAVSTLFSAGATYDTRSVAGQNRGFEAPRIYFAASGVSLCVAESSLLFSARLPVGYRRCFGCSVAAGQV